MDLSASQLIATCFTATLLLAAALFTYPIQLILVHTLVETPFDAAQISASAHYEVAPTKDDFDVPDEVDERDLEPPTSGSSHEDGTSERAIKSMHTRSILTAWANLQSVGFKGLFRAVPAQVVYTMTHELLFVMLGGMHPVMQLLNRLQSEDPANVKFSFSPLLIFTIILSKVLLIPLGLVVMRQIIGKPDGSTWWGHLKTLVSTIGVKAMLPIVVPQVLKSGIPLLLQNATTFLHFLYLQETVVEPGWYAFFAILELVWQLFMLIFIISPLQAVLYRAQTSVLAHMPKFDAFVPFPTSYISPLAELKQIVEEERYISGTWYGRYLRAFRVIATTSVVIFVVAMISAVPLMITGAINVKK
ncbi:protein of unknown function [Taphrina deformans PYCC 5710]|uniref:Uncharacterized protein n=1 Tax=Taphrina deformans (strain PYCC 5710 / ATCC 11124 / CBS 356.35 / IMI 108563 / JCM 9778 / NBRC 8474) TaxID=1097556 RepID=R4XAB1_TAPDE|nr:protein of unknown function [Taphrina deformans PYCC 5710]|eukprot:CCG82743.1 protein of unknown function [Taphrina deformans PYCC 5710]